MLHISQTTMDHIFFFLFFFFIEKNHLFSVNSKFVENVLTVVVVLSIAKTVSALFIKHYDNRKENKREIELGYIFVLK